MRYDNYEARIPKQCRKCSTKHRYIEYDPDSDITKLVFGMCQDCRYGNIKMMNMEYHQFRKKKEDEDSDFDDSN
jgi:hypothetical protein